MSVKISNLGLPYTESTRGTCLDEITGALGERKRPYIFALGENINHKYRLKT